VDDRAMLQNKQIGKNNNEQDDPKPALDAGHSVLFYAGARSPS
jgi:hypothetical protein